jgi:hypothetical protein
MTMLLAIPPMSLLVTVNISMSISACQSQAVRSVTRWYILSTWPSPSRKSSELTTFDIPASQKRNLSSILNGPSHAVVTAFIITISCAIHPEISKCGYFISTWDHQVTRSSDRDLVRAHYVPQSSNFRKRSKQLPIISLLRKPRTLSKKHDQFRPCLLLWLHTAHDQICYVIYLKCIQGNVLSETAMF